MHKREPTNNVLGSRYTGRNLQLPRLPKPLPVTYAEGTSVIREMLERDIVPLASSPYPQRFRDALDTIESFLHSATLEQNSHSNLQLRLREEIVRKTTSRRSISKGGVIKICKEASAFKKSENVRKLTRKITVATNKVKKLHSRQGINARSLMRENKERFEHQIATTGYGDVDLLDVLHQMTRLQRLKN